MQAKHTSELAHSLFEYIKEVSLLREKKILDVRKQKGHLFIHRLKEPSCISIASRNTEAGQESAQSNWLVRFHKPDFTSCPAPGGRIEPWLKPGWSDYHKPADHYKSLQQKPQQTIKHRSTRMNHVNPPLEQLTESEEEPILKTEEFADDGQRVLMYQMWINKRDKWVEEQKHIAEIRDAFGVLFDMYNQLKQSPDTLELMLGNGLLTDRNNREIYHPIFLKRLQIELDAVQNTLLISDTEDTPQLYNALFSVMEDIQSNILQPMQQKAAEQNIHPLDQHEGADLLRAITNALCHESYYDKEYNITEVSNERITVRWAPVFFMRNRPDGTVKAIESILSVIENGGDIPGSLTGIIGEFGTEKTQSSPETHETIWHDPSQMPLEDENILLPKPANREQMEIVRRIGHAPAVLVQGPPGTGKTHTIANLMGHFLAQGNTVLVTSHTSKALKVLKDKVPDELKPLCVAMLGDNRRDMENSIDTIIERTAGGNQSLLYNQVETVRKERHQTLLDLKAARDRVFAMHCREFETVLYEGESFTPANAARYIAEHEEQLQLIPGNVKADKVFPLSESDLQWLYASNASLSTEDEVELSEALPDPSILMAPAMLADESAARAHMALLLQQINTNRAQPLEWDTTRCAVLDTMADQIYVRHGDELAEKSLRRMLDDFSEPAPVWACYAMSDGATQEITRAQWERLLSLIDETYTTAQRVLQQELTIPVVIAAPVTDALLTQWRALYDEARVTGHIKKGLLIVKREKRETLASATISGHEADTSDDALRVVNHLELLSLRKQLDGLWNSLIAAHGGKSFSELGDQPERVCHQQKAQIKRWLNWDAVSRNDLYEQARQAGIGLMLLQPLAASSMLTEEQAQQQLQQISNKIIPALDLLHVTNQLYACEVQRQRTIKQLQGYAPASTCNRLLEALESSDTPTYSKLLERLATVRGKAGIVVHRRQLIEQVNTVAPDWAEALRTRAGIHGSGVIPEHLRLSWKLKQLAMQVDEIANTPLAEAEKRVTELTVKYRKLSERLAGKQAWYHLQKRIDDKPRLRQVLNGWKQTVGKFGKGNVKNIVALRAAARDLMIECQQAVPAWIMPVSSVMNNIDPKNTKFDVVIIDEASQSDITAVPVLVLGQKVIVVGDDEQVSPLGVGAEEERITKLMNMYIKGKIPNAHLWDAKTSLYDIAAQVYQPLMLREHFRCVPDIIGYSNSLSYQGRIKPLREKGASAFKTSVVPYRVQGVRQGKINREEAKNIVALIRGCIAEPAYSNSTIGVISLLGDEQAQYINTLLINTLTPQQYEHHQILCGNASHFQGDERDIIFLSMVDSNSGDGPLSMLSGEGAGANGKAMKQRYNVAVSRARDQLWLVHSLDSSRDLKNGDMRRGLLEYCMNPQAHATRIAQIEEEADSPFEVQVATALVGRGFHIVQQWQVGAYFLDMVAEYKGHRIAIECDGERYHSGEEKVRQDMERQAQLERLGWRFIRIRGSEYFRNESKTIERVINDLHAAGIEPEEIDTQYAGDKDDLLDAVKAHAHDYLQDSNGDQDDPTNDPQPPSPPQAPQAPSTPPVGSTKPTDSNEITIRVEEHEKPVKDGNRPKKPIDSPNGPQLPTKATQNPPKAPKPPVKPPIPPKPPIQQPPQLPQAPPPNSNDPLLKALDNAELKWIDNRAASDLLWVIYDASKADRLAAIAQAYALKPALERRGAVATGNKPAWRIPVKKR